MTNEEDQKRRGYEYSVHLREQTRGMMASGLELCPILTAHCAFLSQLLSLIDKEDSDFLLKGMQYASGVSREALKDPNPDNIEDAKERLLSMSEHIGEL